MGSNITHTEVLVLCVESMRVSEYTTPILCICESFLSSSLSALMSVFVRLVVVISLFSLTCFDFNWSSVLKLWSLSSWFFWLFYPVLRVQLNFWSLVSQHMLQVGLCILLWHTVGLLYLYVWCGRVCHAGLYELFGLEDQWKNSYSGYYK